MLRIGDHFWTLRAVFLVASSCSALAADHRAAHGLWVWKSSEVLESPRGAETLRDFCLSETINEVYVSFSVSAGVSAEIRVAELIVLLHKSNIRVDALLSSENADEPGEHRERLLDHVRSVVRFNRTHAASRFDGIHLDIEPQKRPENDGPGNLRFFPGLVDAYRAVRTRAEAAGLSVNADIQNKLLKGNVSERRRLLSSLPNLTLMLYELDSPGDRQNTEAKIQKLRAASRNFLKIAYEGLDQPDLATMTIALRTPDYGELLPRMLRTLDEGNRSDPHYRGWAWHSYGDSRNMALAPLLIRSGM